MDEIEEYIKRGIVGQIFEAEISLIIWDKIAGHRDKYDKQDAVTKKLFSYIQRSSGTNYILNTAKIFDNPSKKYPTRCLLSFFDLVENKIGFPQIENDTGLIKLLKEYKCSETLISKVKNSDSTAFAKEFCLYYRQKYADDSIKKDIDEVKFARDKYIAHNEDMKVNGRVEMKTFRNLLDFATEVVSVFSFAYFNSRWTLNNKSLIKESAEKDSYFIKATLDKLIKN